jgi:uncharacterized protein (DUF433 family)
MDSPYIDLRSGGYYVAGTRVSLDSIVYGFRGGDSPETIQRNFGSLSLEQVYGALAFYLGNQDAVDRNIAEGEKAAFERIPSLKERNPAAWARLEHARVVAGKIA